ncbi:glycosyltransferase family 4 protein [Helcobacillus massiliensis]|uniref:glycosyltransferase family 4 protein n=1 Tax=Helcobacillus massiliensis TaxID=521392 RepID=UPI0039EE1083
MRRCAAEVGGRLRRPAGSRGGAVLATRLFSPELTPAAFRHRALFDHLRSAGIPVGVLTTSVPGDGEPADQDVSRWPVLRDSQGHVKGYLSYMSFDVPLILRVLVMPRPAVIIAEPPPTTGFAVMVAAGIRRIPYVYYAADIWADAAGTLDGTPAIVPAVLGFVERLVWRRAAVVMAISPGVEHRIRELCGDSVEVAMIGNGIRVGDFSADGPERGARSTPVFVYAGTVSEWHGAGIFLEAFRRVREVHPSARLEFFSEGSEKAHLEQVVEETGLGGVSFHSRVGTDELSARLRGAAASLACVRPGQGYDFAIPTKIYASTASGTPVIYAGEGPTVSMIEENRLGWAVDYTPESAAEAMLAAIDEPERVGGPQELRRWTEGNASLEAVAARIVGLVERSLSIRLPRRR